MSSVNLTVSPAAQQGCISIGNFDGVHLGHVAMLRSLRELAQATASPAVIVTFDPHPIAVLRPSLTPPVLTTVKERTSLLLAAGASQVVVLPVSWDLLQMTAEQFFADVIVRQFQAVGIVEGPNFHFGHDRMGNVGALRHLCESAAIRCRIVESHDVDGCMISSSRIRELLCSRAMAAAVELLGHPYRMSGIVRHGAGRGAALGFPTANLADMRTLLPAHGVYAGVTRLGETTYPAAVSIGPNPTFGEHREKIECHVVGYAGNLYDSELNIDLLGEVRPLQAFSSVDALVRQIRKDIEDCSRIAEPWQAGRW